MQAKLSFFVLTLFFAIHLTSCGPNYLYQQSYPIASETWTYSDTLNFDFPIQDTITRYNLLAEVIHSPDFPTQNMYILISTRFPDGKRLQMPLSLEMADKLGQWYGDCSSEKCTLQIPLQTNAFFNQMGDYQITMQQYTRTESLEGIMNVGFMVQEVKE